jgi:hypothetical protein
MNHAGDITAEPELPRVPEPEPEPERKEITENNEVLDDFR